MVFPGSNCDRDMHHVLRDTFDLDTQYIWHTKQVPSNMDAVILPGGFSYGDRLRAGAIAAHSPVMSDVKKMAADGMPVLGVCNGFQILVESGILPGALLVNESLCFMCRWTRLVVENTSTPFTSRLGLHQEIPIPIANGEGRYYASEDMLRDLYSSNRVVFRYKDEINGSVDSIAGICNDNGNVVGMMPHPERAAEPDTNPVDCMPARLIFKSLVESLLLKDNKMRATVPDSAGGGVVAAAATTTMTTTVATASSGGSTAS